MQTVSPGIARILQVQELPPPSPSCSQGCFGRGLVAGHTLSDAWHAGTGHRKLPICSRWKGGGNTAAAASKSATRSSSFVGRDKPQSFRRLRLIPRTKGTDFSQRTFRAAPPRASYSSDQEVSFNQSTSPPWTSGQPNSPEDDFYDDWNDETFANQAPPYRPVKMPGLTELDLNRWRQQPVEEKYRIQVERGVSEERKQELGISYWSTWSSPGPCAYVWEWRADEQVYITRGTLRVTPQGCGAAAEFKAGDLVRFPKWLLAELEIVGSYEQRYRFRAYGDDN